MQFITIRNLRFTTCLHCDSLRIEVLTSGARRALDALPCADCRWWEEWPGLLAWCLAPWI